MLRGPYAKEVPDSSPLHSWDEKKLRETAYRYRIHVSLNWSLEELRLHVYQALLYRGMEKL